MRLSKRESDLNAGLLYQKKLKKLKHFKYFFDSYVLFSKIK
jgi:hypothetical protein